MLTAAYALVMALKEVLYDKLSSGFRPSNNFMSYLHTPKIKIFFHKISLKILRNEILKKYCNHGTMLCRETPPYHILCLKF